MKQIKRSLSIVTALALVLAVFAGCGGSDGFQASSNINVISREEGSGTRGAFVELFGIEEEDADGNTVDRTIEEAEITSSTSVMMTSVAEDLYSIGYISLGSLNETVKALPIDGAEASVENIKNESYKVSRPFNIVTKGAPEGLAKDFIAFIMSADGQAVIEENSYISVAEDAAAFQSENPSGTLSVAGSSSVTPVMEKLKEAYTAINPNATIEVQQSDSSIGVSNAIDGVCDIGMASRDIKDSELENGLEVQTIALDGIAVIVNLDNPATGLTSEQVKNIYTGQALVWEDVVG